ncbi:MAG: hypothetical protein GY827_09600 [Cytophagales bacterium]|nr:hypothetical protein [Cytophagales bacterium]
MSFFGLYNPNLKYLYLFSSANTNYPVGLFNIEFVDVSSFYSRVGIDDFYLPKEQKLYMKKAIMSDDGYPSIRNRKDLIKFFCKYDWW